MLLNVTKTLLLVRQSFQFLGPDTDEDGVPDDDDGHTSNDGILDTEEGGETLDTDNDGIPNRIDPDSDNDGCLDVREAGFVDSDSDGKVGAPVITVNDQGKVLSHWIWTFHLQTPNDLDGNGIKGLRGWKRCSHTQTLTVL